MAQLTGKKKLILLIFLLALVLFAKRVLFTGNLSSAGTVSGLPGDFPLESSSIVESETMDFPQQGVRQLNLSYQSSKNVAEKYTEYKRYMQQAGYNIEEESESSPISVIFGTKDDSDLSVAVSSLESGCLVQISYLEK